MTICITRIDFYHLRTILHTFHVPNWFERVVLRRKKIQVVYTGRKSNWQVMSLPLGLSERKAAKLFRIPKKQLKTFGEMETALKKKAKSLNRKTLHFA